MSATAIPYDVKPHPLTGMYNGKLGIWLFLASEIMLFGALFSSYILLRVGAPDGTWPIIGAASTRGDTILNVPLAAFNTVLLITSSVTMVLAWANLKMNNFRKGQLFMLVTIVLAAGFLVVKYFEYSAKLHHYAVTFDEPFERDGVVAKSREVVSADGTSTRTIYYLYGHAEKVMETEGGAEVLDHVVFTPDAEDGETGHGGNHVELRPGDYARLTTWGPEGSSFLATYFTLTGLHGLHIIGGILVMAWFLLTGSKMWKTLPEKYVNRVECTGLYWHFVDLVWIFLFPVLYLL